MERLIPDLVQPIRRAHPRPNSRIDEIEKEQTCDALWRLARQRLHCRAANVVADNAGPPYPQRVQQRQHIRAMICRSERPVRFVAVTEAAQIGGYEPVAL